MRDYSKLKGQIVCVFGTQENFAKEMKLSKTSLSNKLNCKTDFTQVEIETAVELLGIPRNEIDAYFFSRKVENN